jgi:hypothetical protein
MTTPRDFFLLLCLVVGSVQGFSFGGLSIWRAVVLLLSFSVSVFGGLDQPLFATRWSNIDLLVSGFGQIYLTVKYI